MKKSFLLVGLVLAAVNMQAGLYLVQSGAEGAAKWDNDVITEKSATLVDLTSEGKCLNEWLTSIKDESAPDVWIAAGTYTFKAAATLSAGIKIYGGFVGAETSINDRSMDPSEIAWLYENETVFDAESKCVFFSNNTNSTVSGITFMNGKSTANGGAFRTGNNSKVLNCQFINNEAKEGSGQGTLQIYNANVTVTDCLFKNNKGGQGAGVYANIAAANTVTVTGCSFIGNSASGTSNAGGGIHYQNAGTFVVDRCYFEGNTSVGNGAAISFAGTNAASKIVNSVIYKNEGSKTAIYSAAAAILFNTVVENEGGALYATKGNVTNNIFWGTDKVKAGLAVNNAAVVFDHNASVLVPAGDTQESNTVKIDSINSGSEEGVLYPYFNDLENGDLTVAYASAMRAAGVAVEGVATDYLGVDRAEVPTIGAYECTADAPVNPETKLDNANMKNNAIKRIVNGQMIIEYNGVHYNALGAQL